MNIFKLTFKYFFIHDVTVKKKRKYNTWEKIQTLLLYQCYAVVLNYISSKDYSCIGERDFELKI